MKKYRRLKRMAGFLLTALLILGSLSGCSKKENGGIGQEAAEGSGTGDGNGGDTAMGRFLEEEVTLPTEFSNIYDMKKLEDGTIRFIGSDGNGLKNAWDSRDFGATWEKAFDFPEELQDEGTGYIDYAALSSDGQTACVFNEIVEGSGIKPAVYLLDKTGKGGRLSFELPEMKEGNGSAHTFVYSGDIENPENEDSPENENSPESEGSPESENSPESESSPENEDSPESESNPENGETGGMNIGNMALDLKFLGNDQLLIKDIQDNIYQVSTADGSVAQTWEFDGTMESHQCFVAGKTMVIQTSTETLLYDTETGEQKQTEEALQKVISENGTFTVIDTTDNGESIYGLSRGGLYHYKFGGSVLEQLIDGTMNSLGGPSFYAGALTMLDEQNLLVAANDTSSGSSGGMVMLKYTWSPDTPAKPDKELKVYSLYNNKELRQAISSFQKDHTDVYINYEAAMSGNSGMTTSDALKTLTTEIMAGKGPDVLVLDGMPVETYIEKGILKDISSVVTEGNYFESILKAYEDEQGQNCALPARFQIPVLQASGAYFTEDFDELTGQAGCLSNQQPDEIIRKFWYTCGAAWRKDDKTLDEGKITEFLTKLKNAYGEYDSSLDDIQMDVAMMEEGTDTEMMDHDSISQGVFDVAFGDIKVNVGLLGGYDMDFILAANKKLGDGDYGRMPGQAEHVFVPAMIMGISSKSTQQETAEQFVKFLFTPQAQKFSQGGGFAVEKDAFRTTNDGHEYEGKDGLVGVGGADMDKRLDYELRPRTEEEMKKFTELAESLATPSLQDEVIRDAVVEQGTKVLKGELSPEEATGAIMQKVNIYLAE